MAVDFAAIDFVDPNRPRSKCRNRHARCDKSVNTAKQIREAAAQNHTPVGRADVIEPAVGSPFGEYVAIVLLGAL